MSRPRDHLTWNDYPRSIPEKVYGPLSAGKVRQAERPIPVRAWVEFMNGNWSQIDGDVMAWTDKAVRFRYVDSLGNVASAWIWANAVIERR